MEHLKNFTIGIVKGFSGLFTVSEYPSLKNGFALDRVNLTSDLRRVGKDMNEGVRQAYERKKQESRNKG